jgi:pimeloyl-ACP methyl ester carboxylesterase
MGTERICLRVEIEWPEDPQPAWIELDFLSPPAFTRSPLPVLFCFGGGGVTRDYFDMQGEPAFSFSRALAARGMLVISIDHPGVGGSFTPRNGFEATAAAIARAEAKLVALLLERIAEGTLHPALPTIDEMTAVGVGHSMGAMLVALQQSIIPQYAALGLLCFGTRGLPEVLTDAEKAAAASSDGGRAACAELARARFGAPFVAVVPPRAGSAAAEAVGAVQAPLPAVAAMQSMLPGNIAAEAGGLAVPLFLAAGDRDLTGPPHDIPAAFVGCRDITLLVVADAGHHVFVAEAAPALYARFAQWVFGLEPQA